MGEEPPRLRPGTVLVATGVFFITLVAFLRSPLLPSIGRDLDLGPFGLSAVVGSFGLGRVLVDLPAGSATDRFSVGGMLGVAASVVGVAASVMAVAPNLYVLLIGAVLLGMGSAWAAAGAVAFFASAPRASRGMSVSIYGGALLTAQAMGPLIAGFAAVFLDWRIILLLGGVMTLVVAPVFFRAKTVESSGREAKRSGLSAETDVPTRVLWLIYALPAVQFGIGAAVLQTLIPIIGEGDLGYTPATVGLALGIGGAIRFVSALSAGAVSDRYGRKVALVPGLSFQLIGLFVFAGDFGVWGWWLSVGLLTIGSVAANVGGTMLADLSEGGPLGRRLGRYRLVGDSALMLAPLLTGYLFAQHGLRASVSLLVCAAAAVLAGSIRLPETRLAATSP